MTAASSPAWVEAAATTARVPMIDSQFAKRRLIDGRRRYIEFEIAAAGDPGCAELRITLRIGAGLGQTEIEAAEQRPNDARQSAPAVERAFRHAAVDQDHRDAAVRTGQDQIGPQVGFNEERQIRLPVIEKSADKSRRVERNELMHRARRQALLGERRRGDGAGSDQHGEIHRPDALNERNDRQHFADAGAVQPDQRAIGTRYAGHAVTFAKPRRIFLAAFQAPRQQPRCHRRRRRDRSKPVQTQSKRQSNTHAQPLRSGRTARGLFTRFRRSRRDRPIRRPSIRTLNATALRFQDRATGAYGQ